MGESRTLACNASGVIVSGDAMDVIVVGAGIAGLAAAHYLSHSGLKVIVLEAQDRIGGRILTIRDDSIAIPIEMGAEFIHGKPESVLSVIRNLGLSFHPVSGTNWACRPDSPKKSSGPLKAWSDVSAEMRRKRDSEQTFTAFIESLECSDKTKSLANSYVEGFHAADPTQVSLQSLILEDEASRRIDGDKLFRLEDGWRALVHWYAIDARVRIHLKTSVKRIQWSRGRVNAQVIAEQPGPSSFEARAVLVTVPLPHLQRHDALGFDPEIPVIRGAARRLAMGQVLRLTLSFAQRVWDEFGDVAFLSCPEGEFPTWWTGMQGASVITAWAGGPKAESLLAESPDCLVETALRALHNILRVPEAQLRRSLRRHYFHDWSRDPFAQGAYSYTPVNSFDARYTLSTPIDNTLFFAGEATNIAGEHGTVHGALDSGVAAARRILTAMETPE